MRDEAHRLQSAKPKQVDFMWLRKDNRPQVQNSGRGHGLRGKPGTWRHTQEV
jgi:hypothetical protein